MRRVLVLVAVAWIGWAGEAVAIEPPEAFYTGEQYTQIPEASRRAYLSGMVDAYRWADWDGYSSTIYYNCATEIGIAEIEAKFFNWLLHRRDDYRQPVNDLFARFIYPVCRAYGFKAANR